MAISQDKRFQMCSIQSLVERPGFPCGLKVLLYESDGRSRLVIEEQLKQCNYSVTSCDGVEGILLSLRQRSAEFDLVLAEARGFMGVAKEHESCWKLVRDLPFILMSENPDPGEVMSGIRLGAAEFMEKPLSILKLKNIWQHSIRRLMLERCDIEKLENISEKPEKIRCLSGGRSSGDTCRNSSDSSCNTRASSQRDSCELHSADQVSCGEVQEVQQAVSPASSTFCESIPELRFCVGALDERKHCASRRKSRESQPTASTLGMGKPDSSAPANVVIKSSLYSRSSPENEAPKKKLAQGVPAPQAYQQDIPYPMPAFHLPPGMEWGLPLNPMALAPGITPPIFPAPRTQVNSALAVMPPPPEPVFISIESAVGLPEMAVTKDCKILPLDPLAFNAPPSVLPPLPLDMLSSACDNELPQSEGLEADRQFGIRDAKVWMNSSTSGFPSDSLPDHNELFDLDTILADIDTKPCRERCEDHVEVAALDTVFPTHECYQSLDEIPRGKEIDPFPFGIGLNAYGIDDGEDLRLLDECEIDQLGGSALDCLDVAEIKACASNDVNSSRGSFESDQSSEQQLLFAPSKPVPEVDVNMDLIKDLGSKSVDPFADLINEPLLAY